MGTGSVEIEQPDHRCVMYCSQQADGVAGVQMLMHGGHSYIPFDDMLPPPAKDMIDDMGEELNDDAETWHPNPRCIPTTKTGFQKSEWKLQKRTVREQR